jgi:hypothetical protein
MLKNISDWDRVEKEKQEVSESKKLKMLVLKERTFSQYGA